MKDIVRFQGGWKTIFSENRRNFCFLRKDHKPIGLVDDSLKDPLFVLASFMDIQRYKTILKSAFGIVRKQHHQARPPTRKNGDKHIASTAKQPLRRRRQKEKAFANKTTVKWNHQEAETLITEILGNATTKKKANGVFGQRTSTKRNHFGEKTNAVSAKQPAIATMMPRETIRRKERGRNSLGTIPPAHATRRMTEPLGKNATTTKKEDKHFQQKSATKSNRRRKTQHGVWSTSSTRIELQQIRYKYPTLRVRRMARKSKGGESKTTTATCNHQERKGRRTKTWIQQAKRSAT